MADKQLGVWFLALPNQPTETDSIQDLGTLVASRRGEHFYLSKLPLLELRVGTIDTLLALSESLGRIDAMARSLVQKLHRTYGELEGSDQTLDVYSSPIQSFITSFEWNAARFNPRAKLPDLVLSIQSDLEKMAERLRVSHGKLQDIGAAISAIERKKTGSLMTRPVREFVDFSVFKDGEYVSSILVVIPVAKRDEFVETYEWLEESDANRRMRVTALIRLQQRMKAALDREEEPVAGEEDDTEATAEVDRALLDLDPSTAALDDLPEVNLFEKSGTRTVLPDSAVLLFEESDALLFQVDVIKPGLEWFRNVCRELGYVVRDISGDGEDAVDDEKKLEEFRVQFDERSKRLISMCRNDFSDAFSRFIHLKIIRVFVEAVLRYGLPINFSVSVVKPPSGGEKSLLAVLSSHYAHLVDKALQAPAGEGEVDFSGVGGDFYPFVHVPLKLELA